MLVMFAAEVELDGRSPPLFWAFELMTDLQHKKNIKGLKGQNGIKRRKYRFQETVVLAAEFSRKSSKSGRGLSGILFFLQHPKSL